MRDIKYIEQDIISKQRYLEDIPSLRLGMLFKGLYYNCSDVKHYVSNDRFKITFHCHDTGISTNSYIIKPDGTLYEFAQRTYWYNESQYGFNKWYYENGAWDKAYDDFIQRLEDKLTLTVENKISNLNEELSKAKDKLQSEKSSVESMFL